MGLVVLYFSQTYLQEFRPKFEHTERLINTVDKHLFHKTKFHRFGGINGGGPSRI